MGTLLFEHHPSPIIIYDEETLTILKANKAFRNKYKYTSEDISEGALTIELIRLKRNIPQADKIVKHRPEEDGKEPKFTYHLSKTGEKFYVQENSEAYSYNGQEARLVVFQDLTKQIEAEKESLQAYKELQQHIANSPLASVKLDQNLRIREWSKRAEEMLGFSKSDVYGKTLIETLFNKNDDDGEIKRKIWRLRSGQRNRDTIDLKIATKKNDNVLIRMHVSAQQKKDGELKSVLALMEDITERQTVESYYKKLFEFARDGVYLLTKEGRLVDCNQRAADQLQISVDEAIGTKIIRFAPEYQSDGTLSKVKASDMTKKALKEGYSLFEWTIKRPDGQLVDVEVSLNSIDFSDGQYIHAIAREIGYKKKIQYKLKRSEELFRNLFLKSPAALVMVDPYDNVKAVNERFSEMFGYDFDEIDGKDIDKLIVPPELYDEAPKVSEGNYMQKEFQLKTIRLTKSREQKHVIVAGRPVFVEGELVAGFGMYIDITDRIAYEEELNRSVEEKEVMLEEIHHRVKNNLAVISGILQLQAFDAVDETARDALNNSQLRIKSIALVHELLYKAENFTNVSIEAYLHQLVEHIQSSLPMEAKKIDVNIQVDDIEMTMQQAIPIALLINELITNAYKHAFSNIKSGSVNVSVEKTEDQIYLCVADNGKGLADDFNLENNNSLGLKLIKTITQQLNAAIEYGNNGGAEFKFCIPKQ